jgi:hypothetical protein
MDFQKKLEELRALPESTRKIIFWSVLISIGFILACIWRWHSARVLENFNSDSVIENPTSTDKKAGETQEKANGVPEEAGIGGSASSSGATSTN